MASTANNGNRKISASKKSKSGGVVTSNIEMDSHADTIVCGSNCRIESYTGKECEVSPYTDAYETIKSVPIVQASAVYDNQTQEKHSSSFSMKQYGWVI